MEESRIVVDCDTFFLETTGFNELSLCNCGVAGDEGGNLVSTTFVATILSPGCIRIALLTASETGTSTTTVT